MAAQERANIGGDDFGYEDSVFAKDNNSYTPGSTKTPQLSGRDDVGKTRRARASRRTTSIILLGVFSIALIGALIYVTTR